VNKKAILAGTVATLVLAGCGSSSSSSSSSSAAASAPAATTTAAASAPAAGATISAATVPGVGSVLVNDKGHTLYVFNPDQHAHVTCTGSCAAVWPPLMASSTKPTVSAPLKASLLGTDPDPSGGQVITYNGWPLYTYVGDAAAGTASGQAENLNGGVWYAITPAGVVVTKPAS